MLYLFYFHQTPQQDQSIRMRRNTDGEKERGRKEDYADKYGEGNEKTNEKHIDPLSEEGKELQRELDEANKKK